MTKHEVLDRHARNNRFGGYPEHMEDYRLANGYEWRDGLLQPKVDPRSLNDHGIPTNDFNLPAQPGLNMLPLNARTQTRNRYLDQSITKGMVKVRGVGE
ncbi:MAG: hypothetical protein Q4B28_05045 [bacterium]|nr:hypothetical protein [bacterium]